MQNKKVSIIVPIYKVEDYLKRCVDSITNQTYKNLEIVLVDDGSPDNCPAICDELEKTDERIKVVHKENGGLSDARNAGMDVSTGDYIGFVDSDDYIDADMFEILVDAIEEHDADISCCRYTRIWDDGKVEKVGNDDSVNVYEGLDGLKEYLYARTVDPFAWNKLFKAEQLGNLKYPDKNVRFIKGILGEDNPFNIELLKTTKRLVVVGKSKYNYLQAREGAITNSAVSQKKIDSVFFWDTVSKDCKENYPELLEYAVRRQALFYVGLFNRIYEDESYKAERAVIREFARENLSIIKHSKICENSVKLSVLFVAKCPKLYVLIMRIYKKLVGEAKL